MQWGQPSGVYTFSGQFSAPVPLSATSRYNALADLLAPEVQLLVVRALTSR